MLFSACQKEEIDSIPEGAIKLTTEGFSNGDGSKTSVNGYTVEWVNGDKVTINNEEYTVFVAKAANPQHPRRPTMATTPVAPSTSPAAPTPPSPCPPVTAAAMTAVAVR